MRPRLRFAVSAYSFSLTRLPDKKINQIKFCVFLFPQYGVSVGSRYIHTASPLPHCLAKKFSRGRCPHRPVESRKTQIQHSRAGACSRRKTTENPTAKTNSAPSVREGNVWDDTSSSRKNFVKITVQPGVAPYKAPLSFDDLKQ